MQSVRLSSTGKRWFPLDVQGESKFDQNIRSVSGFKNQSSGINVDNLVAQVIIEDPNDPQNAIVNVFINGLQVGFLGYQESHDFRRRMEELGCANFAGECEARIRGGFKLDDGKRANFAVNLDLDPKTMKVVNQSMEGFLQSDDQFPKMSSSTKVLLILGFIAVTLCAVYAAVSHNLSW
jgi:hypothetical protein